jgi:hypothetical protein
VTFANLPRVIVWVSAGAPSAVAAKLSIQKYAGTNEIVLAYCETGMEHPDNERFLNDVTRWTNHPVARLKSTKYKDTWEVWEHRKYLAGIDGAPCTTELKIKPRVAFQRVDDIHVFGYTEDPNDLRRAESLREHFFELTIETPLIDKRLNRAACLALIEMAGLALPVLYGLGWPNNNCILCVKSTSPDYYALGRLHFPDVFWRLAKLSRALGVRLCRINGERVFIDEIPEDWPTTKPVAPACDFLCHLVEMDMLEGEIK